MDTKADSWPSQAASPIHGPGRAHLRTSSLGAAGGSWGGGEFGEEFIADARAGLAPV